MTLPLVLLPGMMCDARIWAPQIEELTRETLVTVAPVSKADSVEAIAADLLPRLPADFVLAGHGLGGMVAMEMLRTAPARISRLVLMDTSCQTEQPAVAAAREPKIISAQCGRLDHVLREEIQSEHYASGHARLEIMQLMLEMGLRHGPGAFVRQSRAMQRRPDQQATLRRAKTKTWVICGAQDAIYPPRRHEFIAHLMPNAELHVISGAGYLPMLEQPDAVTALLREVLGLPYLL